MKWAFKLFLINMVIVLLLLYTNAIADNAASATIELVDGPVGIFLVGVGLIGLGFVVRKRFAK